MPTTLSGYLTSEAKATALSPLAVFGSDAALVDSIVRFLLARWRASGRLPDDVLMMTGAETDADPAKLFDTLAAPSLFGPPPYVVVTELTDKQFNRLKPLYTLDGLERPGVLIASSALKAKSKTRQLVESAAGFTVIAAYDARLTADYLRSAATSDWALDLDPQAADLLSEYSATAGPTATVAVIEKAALLTPSGETVTADALIQFDELRALHVGDALASALLAGDLPTLMAALAEQKRQGSDATSFLLLFGRLLTDLASASLGSRTYLFWKSADALKAASARDPNLSHRLRDAAAQVVRLEARLRSGAETAPDSEVERGLIRIARVFAARRA